MAQSSRGQWLNVNTEANLRPEGVCEVPKVKEGARLSAYRGDKFNPRVVHTLFPDAQSEYFGHFVSNQGSGH